MNDLKKYYLILICGFFCSSIYLLTPLDTIVHENLHCSGCYILSSACSCNITYNFYDMNNPSYASYKLNIKTPNINNNGYIYNCKIYSLGNNFKHIIPTLLPYTIYPAYIFILSIINIFNFKYRKFTYLFIFINSMILFFSITTYLLIPNYSLITDFQSVAKTLSYSETVMLLINVLYLPTLSITIYCIILIYKLHYFFSTLNNINYLNNTNTNNINSISIIENFQEYIKINDFIKSYNIISVFHLFKLFKIGLYFYIIINSQCYFNNEQNTTLTKNINMNLTVYYLFNIFNVLFDLLLIILIYFIANKKIKVYTFIIMPLTNILYFVINWKYYILINSINSIIFIIYYFKNI